jgi:virulence factor
MNIGIIGAGNIAQKAYLPTYAALQDQHNFMVYSRDLTKAQAIASTYNFQGATDNLDNFDSMDAVMIHAATPVHFDLAKRFLSQGIKVFMDKPISENFEEVEALTKLASDHKTKFMVGFNRRFAPMVAQLRLVDANLIDVTKNRINHPQPIKYALYDLFIHPLDTLIYLLGDTQITDFRYKIHHENGHLHRITVILETQNALGFASLNAVSGANTETITMESPTGTYTLKNLTDMTIETATGSQIKAFGDWETTLHKRGFEPMVLAFLNDEPTRQEGIVTSHGIIDTILAAEGIV